MDDEPRPLFGPGRRYDMEPAPWGLQLQAVGANLGLLASVAFAQQLELELGKIEFRLFGWALLGWTVTADGPWNVLVVARFEVCERDHGERTGLQVGERVDLYPMQPREILARARDMIRRAVLHEVDELLYVGDARPFDPHARGG